eukprot:TRINITY_DN39433_c0_g1_i1.p1 TRINITY_DN39433_c0_g1~~TRINITY_DN39433_c0_g1_i1.p1  ORF type:complete len:1894 (-),score=517.53 TRINITY_DN39433_c0_g1_i1:113-5794(-)
MSGAGGGGGDVGEGGDAGSVGRPETIAGFVDDEAEESGAEGAANDDEGEGVDDGADLAGFIDDAPAAEGAEGAAGEAEAEPDSSDEDDNQDLDEEDLAVLEEAGLDTSVVKRRRIDGASGGEPSISLGAEPSPAGAAAAASSEAIVEAGAAGQKRPADAAGDDFDFSEGESVDQFVIEDPSAKKAKKARLDISEEQMKDIMDIFGDDSVLKPIDEVEEAAVVPEVAMPRIPLPPAAATPAPPSTGGIGVVAPASSRSAPSQDVSGSTTLPAFFESSKDEKKSKEEPASSPTPTLQLPAEGTPGIAAGITPQLPVVETPRQQPSAETPHLPAASTPVAAAGTPLPQKLEQPPVDQMVLLADLRAMPDPGLQEREYETLQDLDMETADLPERWVQTYCQWPELLDQHGVRFWTDEEHECEAKFIYIEAFAKSDMIDKDQAMPQITKVLELLHFKKLEAVHIIMQYGWQFNRVLQPDDVKTIVEYDKHWQGVWTVYRQVQELRHVVGDANIPDAVKARSEKSVFESENAEQGIRDCYEWFAVMQSEHMPNKEGEVKSSEQMRFEAARKHKFDLKLGVGQSSERATLRELSLSPQDFGANLEAGKQSHKPLLPHKHDDQEQENLIVQLCRQNVVQPDFPVYETVREALILYLSKAIACEPRVRQFVRERFMDMCAISTRPTEMGKAVAATAATGFQSNYRAFHLVNRPIDTIREDDDLFMDCIDLENRGLITLNYSLIRRQAKETKNLADLTELDKTAYHLAALGVGAKQVNEKKLLLEKYEKLMKEGATLTDKADWTTFSWCRDMEEKLLDVARAHEYMNRMNAVHTDREKAEAMYKAAVIAFRATGLKEYLTHDPIMHALSVLYCNVDEQEVGVPEVAYAPLNEFRQEVLVRVLREELYPQLWKEVRTKLARQAERAVCKKMAQTLNELVDVQPLRLTPYDVELLKEARDTAKSQKEEHIAVDESKLFDSDDEGWKEEKQNQMAGVSSILVLNPVADSDNCVAALVNAYGDPIDMRVFFKEFCSPSLWDDEKHFRALAERNSASCMQLMKQREHSTQFRVLLKRYKPAVIAMVLNSPEASGMKRHIERIVTEEPEIKSAYIIQPRVIESNPTVPRLVAYNDRLKEQGAYRDMKESQVGPLYRIAVSSARFLQDPLAETCQLWHDNPTLNSLLELPLHRLQRALPKKTAADALALCLSEIVGKAGVHVNRLRRSQHVRSMAIFAPGLGPRKARLFQKCLGEPVTSRDEFSSRMVRMMKVPETTLRDPSRSVVLRNVLPFLKIRPDTRDPEGLEDKIPGLDMTRLGPVYVPWIESLCREALKKVADEVETCKNMPGHFQYIFNSEDVIRQVIELHRSDRIDMEMQLNNVETHSWHELAGEPEQDQDLMGPNDFLELILNELLEPYKDQRQEWQIMDYRTAFMLSNGFTAESFKTGMLIQCNVMNDQEYPEKPEEKEKKPNVSFQMANSQKTRGSFTKRKGGSLEAEAFNGCERQFARGEQVIVRVQKVSGSLVLATVDNSLEGLELAFPVRDWECMYFVPSKVENWTTTQLGPAVGVEETLAQKQRDWVMRPRNIKHPNWVHGNHQHCLTAIDSVPVNTCIFRPSFRHDMLVAMLKVRDTSGPNCVAKEHCFRPFDVYELDNKTVTKGYEIAHELEIDGCFYNDMDEVIARHMDPISANLRMLQEHPRYGVRQGQICDRFGVTKALEMFSGNDKTMLYYAFILNENVQGHGSLLWALKSQVREEFIEVTPTDFRLWNNPFKSLKELIAWFKKSGWRNYSKCRKEFKLDWMKKQQTQKARRGIDVREGDKRAFLGVDVAGRLDGLSTPGVGAPMSVGGYTAPTGLRTPGAGLSTPSARPGTSTPRPVGLQPGTPRSSPVPGTPKSMAAPGSPAPNKQY